MVEERRWRTDEATGSGSMVPINKLKSEGIYGLKGGVFLTENAEVEGSFGYINHFEMRYAPNPGNLNPIRPELSASLPSRDSFMT